MENKKIQNQRKYSYPVKLSLILKGPVKGVCDIPIGFAGEFPLLLSRNFIGRTLDKMFGYDVLMFSIILSNYTDIYDETIKNNLSFISEKVNAYGGMLSLTMPLNNTNEESDIERFIKDVANQMQNLQIDLLSLYVPNSLFLKAGTHLGTLMEDLVLKGFHNARIFTDFPTNENELQNNVKAGLNNMKKACAFVDNFTLGFVIKDSKEFNLEIAKSLDILSKLQDFTFLMMPPPQFCVGDKLNNNGRVKMPFGICSFNNLNLIIDETGTPIQCLKYKKSLSQKIDSILSNWVFSNNVDLILLEECSNCEYRYICNGLCGLWETISSTNMETSLKTE